MDKNTVWGFVIIIAILLGFSWLNQPSQEQIEARKRYQDSIAVVNQQLAEMQALENAAVTQDTSVTTAADNQEKVKSYYGDFASAISGNQQFVTLENDLLKLVFSTKGGTLYSAELKQYRAHDSLPLILFEGSEQSLGFTLLTSNNRIINTSNLYFKPLTVNQAEGNSLIMRLQVDSASYLDFSYILPDDDYMLGFQVKAHNMEHFLDPRMNTLEMQWASKIRQQEKGRKFESRYATLNYKFRDGDMESLSESKNDSKKVPTRVHWIGFKDQFFSSVLIADNDFLSASLDSKVEPDKSDYIKSYRAESSVAFDPKGANPTNMRLFLGPNQYKILSQYNEGVESKDELDLQRLLPLGWALFRWVNQFLIIPLFNFFGSFLTNYGIIILLMTIVVKLIILPFTFKSYMSSAKMRALKPRIDEINAKIPAEKAMERQQAMMSLYKKVGVSPMGGCLPMLLQMPFLFAMFSFFPSSIELRQESFLWAHDLSSYDAIISWDAYIPLVTPYFGNHISLFCLLMTITNIIYTKINMASTGGDQQMPGMKWIMYLMPVMFMFMFNDYASGLSYYYFISLLITIGQTYLFRLFVDEDKLLKQLEAKKAKPQKKSSFMERLEAAQREQQRRLKDQQRR